MSQCLYLWYGYIMDRTCWGRKFRHAKYRRSTKSFRVQVQWSYFNIISCLSRKQNCRYNYFRTWKCASYVQTWHSSNQTVLHELAACWMCLYYKLVCSCGLHTCTCITGHTKYGSRKYPFRLRGRMLLEQGVILIGTSFFIKALWKHDPFLVKKSGNQFWNHPFSKWLG